MQNLQRYPYCYPEVIFSPFFRLFVKSSAILALVLLWNLSAFAQTNGSGYFVAMLRSECTSAPSNPPPVGAISVGPDYVMMTVGRGDPGDFTLAQQLETDAVFESLMPFYCSISANTCSTNRVQWNVMVYNAAGGPHISGCAASGCGFHYVNPPCSISLPEQIQFLTTWVNVDVTAGILDATDGNKLTAELNEASTSNGNGPPTAKKLKVFIRDVNDLVRTGALPATAAQTLIDGATGATPE